MAAAKTGPFERELNLQKSTAMWPLWFNIGQVNNNFVGRLKQFHQLQQIYDDPNHKITLISGLSGIGKTELAKKFAHEMYSKINTSCTLLNAETAQSLYQSLVNLGIQIGIQATEELREDRNTSELLSNLIELVNGSQMSHYWLVIFDNVDDLHPDLFTCLQLLDKSKNTFIILTSSNPFLVEEDWPVIYLESWKTADAIEFVKRFLKNNYEEKEFLINSLCAKLQKHPLAMQQAMAYIHLKQQKSTNGILYSISDYMLEIFNSEKNIPNEIRDPELSETLYFAKMTYSTLDITIAELNKNHGEIGKLACSILHKMAYLDPNGIQLEFLVKLLKSIKNSKPKLETVKYDLYKPHERLHEAVDLLKTYSLVQVENRVIFIHRLVQKVIRIKLKSLKKDTILPTLMLKAMQNFSQFSRPDVPHLLSLWKYLSNHDKLIQQFPTISIDIFNTLHDFGFVSEMLSFATWNHKRLSEVLGKNHGETLRMKCSLALAMNLIGEREKSLEILKEVWEEDNGLRDGDEYKKETVTTAHIIGSVLKKLRYDDEITRNGME